MIRVTVHWDAYPVVDTHTSKEEIRPPKVEVLEFEKEDIHAIRRRIDGYFYTKYVTMIIWEKILPPSPNKRDSG